MLLAFVFAIVVNEGSDLNQVRQFEELEHRLAAAWQKRDCAAWGGMLASLHVGTGHVFLQMTGLASVCLFAATIQPFGTGAGIPSDGARLWGLFRRDVNARAAVFFTFGAFDEDERQADRARTMLCKGSDGLKDLDVDLLNKRCAEIARTQSILAVDAFD